MSSQKELYEDLSTLWPRMIEAVRIGDRSTLSELEQSAHSLRFNSEENSAPAIDSACMQQLIRHAHATDAEVRRLTEPKTEDMRPALVDRGGTEPSRYSVLHSVKGRERPGVSDTTSSDVSEPGEHWDERLQG